MDIILWTTISLKGIVGAIGSRNFKVARGNILFVLNVQLLLTLLDIDIAPSAAINSSGELGCVLYPNQRRVLFSLKFISFPGKRRNLLLGGTFLKNAEVVGRWEWNRLPGLGNQFNRYFDNAKSLEY